MFEHRSWVTYLCGFAVVLMLTSILGCSESEMDALPTKPPELVDHEYSSFIIDLVGGAEEVRPGKCQLDRLAVARDRLMLMFLCGDESKSVVLDLVALPGPSNALATTADFAIVHREGAGPPTALVDDLVQRLNKSQYIFEWDQIGKTKSKLPLQYLNLRPRTAEIDKKYSEGQELYRVGKNAEALALYVELARRFPYSGVLGMVVSTLASGRVSPEKLKQVTEDAEANPNDHLNQFIAGVAHHYRAHQSAKTMEEKRALYKASIKYLMRVRHVYDFEPRLFIYLAVSHFRLGHQKEAESLVEQAIPLGIDDPDAYYCRAEIFQRVNLERSLRDLDIYLGTMRENMKRGAIASGSKLERVRQMQRYLKAVDAGEVEPKELFDPMEADQVPLELPGDKAKKYAVWLITFAVLSAVGFAILRWRRRRISPVAP